ncbi:MAG TPA: TolC family protein [Candidatus Brocadiaceae bacterium]
MHAHVYFQLCLRRYKFRIGVLIVFFDLCLFNSPVRSQGIDGQTHSERKISLEDALTIALERNPQFHAIRDQVDAALGALRQSKLYPNPVLEFLAEEMPTHEMGLNQSQNLVAVKQPIITGGKRGIGIKLNEKSKEKNEFERDAVLLNVVADTKKAFYKVVADQESFAIAQKVEKIAKNIYQSEKVRFKGGEIPITNVLRAEVELSKARNSVSNAEGNLQNSLKELQTVMGSPEESIVGVTGKLLPNSGTISLDELELKMANNQPSLKASKKNIEIADTQVVFEERQAMPDINVSAGYKRLSQENLDTVQFGIEVPAPLFNRNQGNIQKSRAFSRKAKNDYQAVYNDLLFQLRRDVTLYNVEQKRILEYRDKILPGADKSLKLIEKGYKEGEFGYLDLLDAQRTWAETRISYIESLKNLNLLISDIERLAVVKIGDSNGK